MNEQHSLQIDGVTQTFSGLRALDNVTFSVLAGQVHGLVGESGAGKSTLMAVASRTLVPDNGRVVIDGTKSTGDIEQARRVGLAIARQEPVRMPDLTVAENLYLGVPAQRRPSSMSASEWAQHQLRHRCEKVAIDAHEHVSSLSPEQRFIVEIVKTLSAKPKVLVIDEPTEHLLAEDADRLVEHIRGVTASGCAVVYISHRLRKVQKIARRITVLRDGHGQGIRRQGTERAADRRREVARAFPKKAESGATSTVQACAIPLAPLVRHRSNAVRTFRGFKRSTKSRSLVCRLTQGLLIS
jgi:ribose transport system ATP-binding protein